MKSSINSDYNNDLHNWNEIEKQIRDIAKAGFTNIQWIHGWDGEYMYSKSEMLQARELIDEVNLTCFAIHATEGGVRCSKTNGEVKFDNRYRFHKIRKDYTSKNEYLRLAGIDLLKNRIDLANVLGADTMVLHMQLPYKMFEEDPKEKEIYYQQVMKSFDEIESYAKIHKVRIALENLICTPYKFQEEEFDMMFNRYDKEFMGFCYDSGHASLMCQDDYYYFLKKYNDRLFATHLQDTDSIPRELLNDDGEVLKHDSHRTPYTGVLDWDIIARLVAKSPCKLPCDFEVGLNGGNDQELFDNLKKCQKVADNFDNLVREYRIK
jgi:sugar phosphate isomerase/epimerase